MSEKMAKALDEAYVRGVRDMMKVAAGAAESLEHDPVLHATRSAFAVAALRGIVEAGETLVGRAADLREGHAEFRVSMRQAEG